jgi:MHS family proline/betaine transporter-like MFS transporter
MMVDPLGVGIQVSLPAAAKATFARTIMAASIGNALQFYDFIVFGYFAVQIAGAYFPASEGTRALLLTFGTYGVSFLARPFGAIVLGSYGDRHGRRAALSMSILLMTAGTFLMACMPAYRTIGWAAPAGILAARLLQGFATGGEFGAATAFMAEHARVGQRDLFASLQFATQTFSSVMASCVAWAVAALLTPAALQAWGFRIPFVLGLVIAPVGVYVRQRLPETPEFAASVPHIAPVRTLLVRHWLQVLLAACLIAGSTAGTYLEIYLPTFAQVQLHIEAAGSFLASVVVSLAAILVTLAASWWSDRTASVLSRK